MVLEICLATEKDIEPLKEYFRNTVNDPSEFVDNRIKYYLKNHFVSLAKDDEKIVGHLFFQAKENPLLGVGEFEAVDVLNEYRRKGIGGMLCEKSIGYARDYFKRYNISMRCIYLFTRMDNHAAIRIYEKYGFKKKAPVGNLFDSHAPDEMFMIKFFC